MEIQNNIPELLAELDALREKRGLSYQAVADACNVSKATIYRALTGATEPTMQLVQQIAAVVQYKPKLPVVIPTDYTQDAYVAYLQETMQRQQEDTDRRIQQLHAHYNMLRNQDRRTIRMLSLVLALLVAAFIVWLIIDVTHPTVGWFQREVAHRGSTLASLTDWLRSRVWNV